MIDSNLIHNAHEQSLPNLRAEQVQETSHGAIKCEPVLLMEPCSSNRKQLNDLLETAVIEEVDDEMTIIVGSKGFGAPFQTTAENLIKRENDPISGNVPYNNTVSNFIYMNMILSNSNIKFTFSIHRKLGVCIRWAVSNTRFQRKL